MADDSIGSYVDKQRVLFVGDRSHQEFRDATQWLTDMTASVFAEDIAASVAKTEVDAFRMDRDCAISTVAISASGYRAIAERGAVGAAGRFVGKLVRRRNPIRSALARSHSRLLAPMDGAGQT